MSWFHIWTCCINKLVTPQHVEILIQWVDLISWHVKILTPHVEILIKKFPLWFIYSSLVTDARLHINWIWFLGGNFVIVTAIPNTYVLGSCIFLPNFIQWELYSGIVNYECMANQFVNITLNMAMEYNLCTRSIEPMSETVHASLAWSKCNIIADVLQSV